MDTAEALERATSILQDPEGVRWASDEIIANMNTVQRAFCARTGILRTIATLELDPTQDSATAFFKTPDDFLELLSLRVDGGKPLDRVTEGEMPAGWETQTGTPTGYLFGEYGPTLFRLWPDPDTAVTVRASHERTPKDLSDYDPEVPDTWVMALVYGAVALCYLKDAETKDPNKAAIYQQMYEAILADCLQRSSRSFDRSVRRSAIRPF